MRKLLFTELTRADLASVVRVEDHRIRALKSIVAEHRGKARPQ